MAERQYIGARYVPKFFDNPNTSDAAWLTGVAYEALTIVTYAGNSYTSKKPVPAGVGAPNLNPDYWVATGLFNEQVSQLQNDINSANQRIAENTSAISGINTNISEMRDDITTLQDVGGGTRKVVIIGDSYGMRNTPNYLSVLVSLMPNNYVGQALSGYGFTNGDFYTLFDSFIATLSGDWAADNVTDVIFAGGWNDARELKAGRQTVTSLTSRIRTTTAHAREVCPHARIHTCFMAWHSINSVQNDVDLATLLQVRDCYRSVEQGFSDTLDDVQYVMRNPFFMDNSLFHPNTAAAPILAQALHNNLMAGAYNYDGAYTLVPAYLEDVGVTDNTFQMYISIQKGITKIKSVPFNVSGSMTGGLVCKFKPANIPILMPDLTRSLYLTGWFKGTADGVQHDYVYAMPILYGDGSLKMFINGTVVSTVQGTLLIDSTVDNTNIR